MSGVNLNVIAKLLKKQTRFAFMFPGQGSQRVGMGKELAENFTEARLVFEEVDESLKYNLSSLMFQGDFSELTLTENAQPALLANSIATLRVITKEMGLAPSPESNCTCVLGHSLGEFSAMVAAGVIPLSFASQLVRLRGRAMQTAVENYGEDCAMMALMPLNFEKASKACEMALNGSSFEHKREVCQVANVNAPNQVVLSGTSSALTRAVSIAKESFRVKRAVKLDVSAPFHCSIMKDAAVHLEAEIDSGLRFVQNPSVPIVSNVTGLPVVDGHSLMKLAVQQVTGTVLWTQCVEAASTDLQTEIFVEVGGNVLSALVPKISKSVECLTLGSIDEIKQLGN